MATTNPDTMTTTARDREVLALMKKPNLTRTDSARLRALIAARARARIAARGE